MISPPATELRAPLHPSARLVFVSRLLFTAARLPAAAWETLSPARREWALTVRAYLYSRITSVGDCEQIDLDVALMLYRLAIHPALSAYLAGHRQGVVTNERVISRCGEMLEGMLP